eukprot:COSAG04_NODE_15609_length_526_cov_1.423888_1_plen_171_part_10
MERVRYLVVEAGVAESYQASSAAVEDGEWRRVSYLQPVSAGARAGLSSPAVVSQIQTFDSHTQFVSVTVHLPEFSDGAPSVSFFVRTQADERDTLHQDNVTGSPGLVVGWLAATLPNGTALGRQLQAGLAASAFDAEVYFQSSFTSLPTILVSNSAIEELSSQFGLIGQSE